MKQMRIAECKCNSLAPYSGKEANEKNRIWQESDETSENLSGSFYRLFAYGCYLLSNRITFLN